MKKPRSPLAFVLLPACLALAGCGGNGSPGNPPACVPPAPIAMVYPVSGTVAIPDNLSQVIVATQVPFPTPSGQPVWDIILHYVGEPFGGEYGSLFETAQPPFPTPNQPPPFANPIYSTSSFRAYAPLPANTQVTVYINATNSQCVEAKIGVFDTK